MKYRFSVMIMSIAVSCIMFSACRESESAPVVEKTAGAGETVVLTGAKLTAAGLVRSVAAMAPLTGTLSAPGKVIPDQDHEAQIGSPVQGRVQTVSVKVGDYVAAGRVLMTIEGLEVGAIKAGFLKARANLEFARKNAERQKSLFDEKIGSQKALLECESEYEKALAEYTAEDKRIHSIGLTDADIAAGGKSDDHTSGTLPVKSPIAGVVIERNVVLGQFVDPSATAFKVLDSRSIWVDGQIYEKDLARIQCNTAAVFTTVAYPGREFSGRIIYIGQSVDEQTRTITVRAEFGNTRGELKPQMFGELKVHAGTDGKVLLIPDEAVVKEGALEYVFVQTNDTTFERRSVRAGMTANGMVEIKKGLKEGDTVISKGTFSLKSELKMGETAGEGK